MDEIHRGEGTSSVKNAACAAEYRYCEETAQEVKIPHRTLQQSPIARRVVIRGSYVPGGWQADPSLDGMEVGEGGRGACWEGYV
jgi:hypothetical protein